MDGRGRSPGSGSSAGDIRPTIQDHVARSGLGLGVRCRSDPCAARLRYAELGRQCRRCWLPPPSRPAGGDVRGLCVGPTWDQISLYAVTQVRADRTTTAPSRSSRPRGHRGLCVVRSWLASGWSDSSATCPWRGLRRAPIPYSERTRTRSEPEHATPLRRRQGEHASITWRLRNRRRGFRTTSCAYSRRTVREQDERPGYLLCSATLGCNSCRRAYHGG